MSTPEPMEEVQARIRQFLSTEQVELSTFVVPANVYVLYRVLRDLSALVTNFRSNLNKCWVPRGPEVTDPTIWAGLSMYDTIEQAEQTARRYKGRIGSYVAVMYLPEGDPRILIRPSLGAGHFTIMGCEEVFPELVQEVRPIVGLSA
jgi:hypothetical protein